MKRHQIRGRGLALTMMVAAAATLIAQTTTQIHPASGNAGGARTLVVLADNFEGKDEDTFNNAASFLIHNSLFADSDYQKHAGAFTVKTVFEAITASSPASNYGFEVIAGQTNCSINWTADTDKLVAAAAGNAFPSGSHPPKILVVGNYGYSFGCAHGEWAYITRGALGTDILEHEMGHLLVGLFDEFALPSRETMRHPDPPNYLNCSTNLQEPAWPNRQPECALYGVGLVHPDSYCKMRRGAEPFCFVCRGEIDVYLEQFGPENPDRTNPEVKKAPSPPTNVKITGAGFFVQPPPPPLPQSVHVLVQLTRGSNQGRPLRATDVRAPRLDESRRRGDYVYELTEGGKPFKVGVIAGDPFSSRSYQGAGSQHRSGPEKTGTIVIVIPDTTQQAMRASNRQISVSIWRLLVSDRGSIDLSRLNDLRSKKLLEEVATIAPNSLLDLMK